MNLQHKSIEDSDCLLLINQGDLNDKIQTFESQVLFYYNNPQFAQYNSGQYLMQTKAALSKDQDKHFIHIHIRLHSLRAKSIYGTIPSGPSLTMMLNNGEKLSVSTPEKTRGKINRLEGWTDYTLKVPCDKSQLKQLQKNRLLRMGIEWEQAYQEYEVQNQDLIKNQITCLNRKK